MANIPSEPPRTGPGVEPAAPETALRKGVLAFIHEVDASLHEFGQSATRWADESTLGLYFGLKNLDDRWQAAQSELLAQAERLEEISAKARAAKDHARVQAHLGKAEAVSAAYELREKLHRIERNLHTLRIGATTEARHILDRLAGLRAGLSRQLEGQADASDGAGTTKLRLDDGEWQP
jgi:hypothetical protein